MPSCSTLSRDHRLTKGLCAQRKAICWLCPCRPKSPWCWPAYAASAGAMISCHTNIHGILGCLWCKLTSWHIYSWSCHPFHQDILTYIRHLQGIGWSVHMSDCTLIIPPSILPFLLSMSRGTPTRRFIWTFTCRFLAEVPDAFSQRVQKLLPFMMRGARRRRHSIPASRPAAGPGCGIS